MTNRKDCEKTRGRYVGQGMAENEVTNDASVAATETKKPAIEYGYSHGFPSILEAMGCSLAVTTYQAQRLLTFAPTSAGKLFMWMRVFDRPTGLAVRQAGGTMELAMVSKNKVWIFYGERGLREVEGGNALPHDVVIAPRRAYVTGDIAGHELAFVGGVLHAVNTRFSCVCTLDDRYTFRPVWRPPFVTALAAEDRCHLNGVAVDRSGEIRYLTALGESDTKEGWRPAKASGGIVMEYPSGRIVARGLSMPHSPRMYGGMLWVLDSGRGELVTIHPESGERTVRARFKGFLRGLAFAGDFAFVGVCKIREKRTFGNLPIESAGELECAIHAVDLKGLGRNGQIQFTRGIEELFDIQILPGTKSPLILGFEEPTIDGVFVVP